MTLPLVSIITLNYNNSRATYRFLDSTLELDYENYEVIVVDMNSEIDKAEKEKIIAYKNTFFIQHTSNNGFSAGNNIGIKKASGEFLFLVNNDTILTPDILKILVSTFNQDVTIALVSPRINQLHQNNLIEYAGFRKMNFLTGRTSSIGLNEEDIGQYNFVKDTAAVHGAAMMIKADKLKLLGSLPELYFLYYEEWEYSVRAKMKNLKVLYNGHAIIYHEGSGSVQNFSNLKIFYLNRNRILFIRRNAKLTQQVIFYFYYGLIAFPKALIHFLIREKKGLKPYLAAVRWNLKNKADN